MQPSPRTAWLLLALSLGACRGGAGTTPPPKKAEPPAPDTSPDRPFYEGTAEMRAQAARQIARFEDERLAERLDAARRLTAIGEPAIPALLAALTSGAGPRTRGMSAYTLGFAKDHRARQPLANALGDPDPTVRHEVATALLRLGDVRGFAPLIDALEDPDALVRARATNVLTDATGDALGFKPDDDPIDRAAAVARWRGWLARRYETGP